AELAYWLSRDQRRHEVYEWIHAWTRRHTVAEVLERASLLRIPAAPIGDGRSLTTMEAFRARGVFVPAPERPWVQPRVPYRLGRGTVRPFEPPPALAAAGAAGWPPARTTPAPVTPGVTPPF